MPILALVCLCCRAQAQPVAIIPEPVSTQWHDGHFVIDEHTLLIADDQDQPSVSFFNDYLQRLYGLRLHVAGPGGQPSSGYIRLIRTPAADGGASGNATSPEGQYTLQAKPDNITISSPTGPGIFYGIQTLIQLLPLSPFVMTDHGPAISPASATGTSATGFLIPSVTINDYPRFSWRGLHLDVGRHFFPVEFVKRFIDYIALHKMNYFHWHLTEDQGWRIEIKKYPLLTEVGSCRSGTIIGHSPGTGDDSIEYCGYYTQDQIRDIVKYAADRYITVIPEIELPGHSSAALTAYPWLGCTGGPYHVQHGFGVFKDVFCAGNDLSERALRSPKPNYQAGVITRLAGLPQPVIAAVQGGCFTGGLELVLAADIIVAAEAARFADTHGKFAFVPAWGLSQRLPRRVGQWKAREMSFTGLPISGAEAARIGLANCCVPDDKLDAEVAKLAAAIAGQSRHSVFGYKRLYCEQADLPLAAGLAHEVFNSPGVGADFAERIAAQFKR